MAELLIRVFDTHHADPVKDRRGCYKRGNVVVAMSDGQRWGREELRPRNFYRLRVPDLPPEEADLLTHPELDNMLLTPTGEARVTKRRRWSVDLDALPSVTRMACEAGECGVLPWSLFQSYCRESATQLSFTPMAAGALLAGLVHGQDQVQIPEALRRHALAPAAGWTRREALKIAAQAATAFWVGSVLESIGYRYLAGPSVAYAQATITKTIKSSGGDYTSVVTWESTEQGDLVTADEIRVGECYDLNQTAVATIDGSTTDATRYLKLTVNPAARHAGVYSTAAGKFYWTNAATNQILVISDPFTRVEYLQIRNTHATAGEGVIRIDADSVLVEQCIGWHTAPGAADTAAGVSATANGTNARIRNCALYSNRHGIYINTAAGCEVDNCSCVANVTGVRTTVGVNLVLKNSYMGGNTTRDLDEGASPNVGWAITTSMASDAQSSETGLTNSIAYSTANFTNVTAGSVDLHLVTGSALIDQGTDLSGSFTVDMDGVTRTGTWDVSADSYEVAGGPPFFNRRRTE
jgi:parallel beta-helix repeat protein